MTHLSLSNRQRTRRVDLRLLRKITVACLKEIFTQPQFELGIHLVAAEEMATVNQNFLQHAGSTDVITFDHGQSAASILLAEKPHDQMTRLLPARCWQHVHGEIFISIDDAILQAKEFKTTWQSELVRYVVHGILHLRGFDDLNSVARKKMKREENRVVNELTARFPLSKLQRPLNRIHAVEQERSPSPQPSPPRRRSKSFRAEKDSPLRDPSDVLISGSLSSEERVRVRASHLSTQLFRLKKR